MHELVVLDILTLPSSQTKLKIGRNSPRRRWRLRAGRGHAYCSVFLTFSCATFSCATAAWQPVNHVLVLFCYLAEEEDTAEGEDMQS